MKTDTDPAALPKKGDEVDESTSVGEIADVEPGSTKKATFKLAPGKYAMVCALPGHYEGGCTDRSRSSSGPHAALVDATPKDDEFVMPARSGRSASCVRGTAAVSVCRGRADRVRAQAMRL